MREGLGLLTIVIVTISILSPLMMGAQVVEQAPARAPAPAPAPTPIPFPYPIAKKGCLDKCGNVYIPYPFGIGENCYYNNLYKIICNDSNINPPRPIYGKNIEVLGISLEGEIRIPQQVAYLCYDETGQYVGTTDNRTRWVNMKRFILSTTKNFIVATGCDTYAWFQGERSYKQGVKDPQEKRKLFHAGCMTLCNTIDEVSSSDGSCSGLGCCTGSIPSGVSFINTTVYSFYNHTNLNGFNPCSAAFVAEKDWFHTSSATNLDNLINRNAAYFTQLELPVVFDWAIGSSLDSCSSAKDKGGSHYICKANSECHDMPPAIGGYRCQCLPGFNGNPYLEHCHDINECEHHNSCDEIAKCNNFFGGYNCTCPNGFIGNGTKAHPCTPDSKTQSWSIAARIIVGVGGGIIILLVVAFWLYLQHEHKRLKRMRESFFRQNGGCLLVEKLTRRDRSINLIKIFTIEELEKATDNYDERNIIGRGGFGMVYKGIISSTNGQLVVAIKRSLKVDSNQAEQFVNEVIVLSQLNHKNVVKLLGCCLEEEVPLLVYEYMENGTLYEHLHDERRVPLFTNWEIRLKIAVEVAEVLAYLHTTISIPIIHRDIKSMNILLDDTYTAKVSDFGTSRLVLMDQDQNATMIQGTYGYLDPEYMQIGQLNEKSDVYSFGVVLLELLTREKAVSYFRLENERCLAIYFLRKLKEDHLFEILDDKMLMDHRAIKQVKEVANIARRCLKLKGEDRPSMKQVARELDEIRGNSSHPWVHNRRLLQEETEYLLNETQVYNDGFDTNNTKGSSSTQSSLLELVPMDGGR